MEQKNKDLQKEKEKDAETDIIKKLSNYDKYTLKEFGLDMIKTLSSVGAREKATMTKEQSKYYEQAKLKIYVLSMILPEELEDPSKIDYFKRQEISRAAGVEPQMVKNVLMEYYKYLSLHGFCKELIKSGKDLPKTLESANDLMEKYHYKNHYYVMYVNKPWYKPNKTMQKRMDRQRTQNYINYGSRNI